MPLPTSKNTPTESRKHYRDDKWPKDCSPTCSPQENGDIHITTGTPHYSRPKHKTNEYSLNDHSTSTPKDTHEHMSQAKLHAHTVPNTINGYNENNVSTECERAAILCAASTETLTSDVELVGVSTTTAVKQQYINIPYPILPYPTLSYPALLQLTLLYQTRPYSNHVIR